MSSARRPERHVIARPFAMSPETVDKMVDALDHVGIAVYRCRHGDLIVRHDHRRWRLTHNPGAAPLTVRAVVALIEGNASIAFFKKNGRAAPTAGRREHAQP